MDQAAEQSTTIDRIENSLELGDVPAVLQVSGINAALAVLDDAGMPVQGPQSLARRAFLSGAIAAAGIIPAIALAPRAARAAEPDPVYAAIERFKAMAAIEVAATADFSARERRLQAELGKLEPSIAVTPLRAAVKRPGSPMNVYSIEQLDSMVSPDDFPELNARYRADLISQQRTLDAIIGDSEVSLGDAHEAAREALADVLSEAPKTMAGVKAMLKFALDSSSEDDWGFFSDPSMLLGMTASVAESLDNLLPDA